MTEPSWHYVEGFDHIDLGDSFVMSWSHSKDRLVFELEASLWPGHPLYEPPKPDEFTCYRGARLIFPHARNVQGLLSMEEAEFTPGPEGSVDYGDMGAILTTGTGRYRLCGDYGEVEFESEEPELILDDGSA